jgi:type IV secretory pathway VirB10-like protein
MNSGNENRNQDTEFPPAAPSEVKKIPRPVIIGGICIAVLLFMVLSLPKKHKKEDHATARAVSSVSTAVDEFESKNPVQKDPFSMQETQNNPIESPLNKSSAFGQAAMVNAASGMNRPSLSDNTYDEGPQSAPASYNPAPAVPASPVSRAITRRLDGQYQSMVAHFKSTSGQAVQPVKGDEYKQLLGGGNKIDKVETQLMNLTEDAALLSKKTTSSIPAGTRIRAITLQDINSDHPGYFTAKVISPREISGYELLCQARGNARDRIPVEISKIITPAGNEQQLPGEVQMNYAGLEGEIKTHYAKRLLPQIASAFIGAGAGFLYYKAVADQQLNDEGQRINTADGVIGPPFQAGVQGVQNEIERIGGDHPNTVLVPQGTEFEVLVTQTFEIVL